MVINKFPLYKRLVINTSILAVLVLNLGSAAGSDCEIPHKTPEQEKILERISKLKGKTLTLVDAKNTYKIGICTNPDSGGKATADPVGAVQYEKIEAQTVMGRYNDTFLSSGSNWIMLTYHNGQMYNDSVCNGSKRITNVMIVCEPNTEQSDLKILSDHVGETTPHCFHLFAFGSKYACDKTHTKPDDHLSGGSVFCILFFTGVGLYLVLGFLYQRLVIGAQGMEQIPNFTFWQDFGNLQADGCNFICRCGSRKEANAYRGIDEHSPRTEERDDQLLTM